MPQQAWSDKRERQYEHVKDSARERGEPMGGESMDVAKEIAARTVNKERAHNGEAKQSSALSKNDISSGRRGGLRSHSLRSHSLRSHSGRSSNGATGRTKDQLYEEAKRRNIKGRSTMTKAQLLKVVGR
jgi:hypothetical protein